MAALAMCASANAQSGGVALIDTAGGGGGTALIAVAELSVHGGVTVEFAGDPSQGCEAAGTCDASGVIAWRPPSSGLLLALQFGKGKNRVSGGSLDLSGFGESGAGAVAVVRRGDSGTCTDVSAGGGALGLAPTPGASLGFSLGAPEAGDTFDTRCTGPLTSDLRGALPSARLPFKAIRRGARIDLSGGGPWAASGFSGSVRSTLKLRVTRVLQRGAALDAPEAPPRRARNRTRVVVAGYRLDQLTGSLPIDFAGLPSPATCGDFDSCGVAGTMTLEPQLANGVMTIAAMGSARRPRRDFLTALGLGRGGRRRGIHVAGFGGWEGASGTTSTEATRSGAGTCHDTAPLGSGFIEVTPGPRTARFSYDALGPDATPRTRCPGPLIASLFDPVRLAYGALPLSALGRPIAAVHFTQGRTLKDAGYSVTTRPDLHLGFERLAVRTYTFPGGS